jgi:D-alanyl-D-alanine endopeptidase (penicillin-binding protein 7)
MPKTSAGLLGCSPDRIRMVISTVRTWLRAMTAVAVAAAFVSVSPAAAQVGARSASVRKPTVQRKSSAKKTAQATRRVTPATRASDSVIPRFKVDENGALVPDLRAAAAIIYNPATQEVIWEVHSQDQRSIASITKLMTAVVLLESRPDLTETVPILREDTWQASTTHLRAGDKVTRGDLLQLLLIASDNAAARALARSSPQGALGFVLRMNEKARELGLESTYFADPSGLFSSDVSSAFDIARLIAYAAGDERISTIMRKPEERVWTGRRYVMVRSTNALLQRTDLGDVDLKGGKTGFIAQAGYCFATLLGIPQFKQQVAVVVLGARSNAARFLETRNILTWLTLRAPLLFPKDGSQ